MAIVSSEKLFFRELTQDDVSERYVAWLNDAETNKYLEARFIVNTLDTCRNFVCEMSKDRNNYLFGIYENSEQHHIGNIKLCVDPNHKTGSVGLLIGEKSCRNKGYGTESIRCITKWGFRELGLERIEAGCYESNTLSLLAFLRVGYSIEGFLRKSIATKDQRIGLILLGIVKGDQLK